MPTAKRLASLTLTALIAGCATNSDETKLTKSKGEPPKNPQKAALSKDNAGTPVPLAIDQLTARGLPKLAITSSAFGAMKPIPSTYSEYGEKSSPPLKIAGVPANAKSLLIICDDPDAMEPKPFVHWTFWNIPANTTELRTASPATGQVRQLMNAKQGTNSAGSVGYFGPKPPIGDRPHHYHFQVFALDRVLPVEQQAIKSDVIAAAKGHVVAAGELVGTFAKPK